MIKFYKGNFPLEENQSNQVFFTILTTQVRIEIQELLLFLLWDDHAGYKTSYHSALSLVLLNYNL